MSKSRLELTFGQSRTVNTSARLPDLHVEVTRKTSKRGNDRTNMSHLDDASPALLMQNVRDIRKRLMETEKTLNTITKAEKKLDNDDDLDDLISVTSEDPRRPLSDRLREANLGEDDGESVKSDLATLPESSYAGFERNQPPSSTPNRKAQNRLTGLLEMMDTREPRGSRDSSRERKHSDIEDERQDHRAQVRFLKEANKKVLIQNQKLMNEVEKMSYELQSSRAKVRELSYELDEFRQAVPDLEDKILGLQAETESQDKALREAEERFENCQRDSISSNRKVKEFQAEIDDIGSELQEERKVRKSLESQRDEALQNFIDAQDTLEDFQKKTKDRLKKYEENEDDLRDSLTHANREREELIDRLSWFQAKVKNQQEEIRNLHSIQEAEEDSKDGIEEQNHELKGQISKLSSKIARLEGDSQLLESLQLENRQLRGQLEAQNEQLAVCQQEIEESRTMLMQVEQLAQQVQSNHSRPNSRNQSFSNDSGNFSIRVGGEGPSSESFRKSSALTESAFTQGASGTPNGATYSKNILADLRMKLATKDAEIHRLQASLQERQTNDQSHLIETLRADLDAMVERNQRSAEQAQEMNSSLSKADQEKKRLMAQINDLKREMADRDTMNSSFELRINQRNSQLVDLQEQVNEKAMEVLKFEREVRKKSSKIAELEEELNEKSSQCSHQAGKIKQLEEAVSAHEIEAEALHKELHEKKDGVQTIRDETDRVQRIHQEQCKDYQKQIDILQERVENKSSQANEWEKQTDILRRDLSEKNHRIHEMEKLLNRTQEELETKKKQTKDILRQLESQARDGTNQIKHLEAALDLCKEEIKTYVDTLEETKDLFDREIAEKDEMIKRLIRQSKATGHELEVKAQESEELEKQLLETQTMLEQANGRISHLEDVQTQLQRQVSKLEHDLLTGNSQWLSDQQTMDTKLKQACEDLEKKAYQLKQLTQTLKDVQDQKNYLSSEIDIMENQLKDEQEDNDNKTETISKLEHEIRDMRVQLEQKIELVTDFEDQLMQKNRDMEQQLELVSDLDIEIKRLQDTYQEALVKNTELEKELDKAGFESKAKDEMIQDMKDSLASVQEELSSKKSESSNLKTLLDQRQDELEERVAMVNQLDQTIKEQNKEMEQRIQKLDKNLHKSESLVMERSKQIADLDDRLQQTQSLLREKTLQNQQIEQISQRQEIELQAKTTKLHELEILVDRQKQKLNEQKEENVEITQELRLTREQLQQQHADFMATRRELTQSNREQEKLQRELEEIRFMVENREGDAARLAEELGAAKARSREVEDKHTAELNRLTEEHEDLITKYQTEIRSLREENADYVEANEILKAQLKEKTKHLNEMEQHYGEQVEDAAKALDSITDEIEDRKKQMESNNEMMILKDSEITRLQAKISGLERTLTAMREAEGFNLSQVINMDQSGPSGQLDNPDNDYESNNDEVVLSDVSVQVPKTIKNIQFGQEVEIHFLPKSSSNNNNNSDKNNSAKKDKSKKDQENIQPSGPARVLNFSDCDEKNNYNSVIHRPKPILPSNAFGKNREEPLSVKSKDSAGTAKQQSAFSRISKDKKSSKEDKALPGEKELEPITAMRLYNPETFDVSDNTDPEQCMKQLQDQIRANELRQKDIDRQLQTLEDEGDPS